MTQLARYLEEAKLEELEGRLASEGYSVRRLDASREPEWDLVAIKGAEKLAIEVKARSRLRAARDAILALRDRAAREGYEFNLIVVNPPRERTIEVEGLEDSLLEYIINKNGIPSEIDQLATHPVLDDISALDLTSARLSPEGVEVVGAGLMEVTLEYGGGEERDGVNFETSFPFEFVAELDAEGRVLVIEELHVDTSSFYE